MEFDFHHQVYFAFIEIWNSFSEWITRHYCMWIQFFKKWFFWVSQVLWDANVSFCSVLGWQVSKHPFLSRILSKNWLLSHNRVSISTISAPKTLHWTLRVSATPIKGSVNRQRFFSWRWELKQSFFPFSRKSAVLFLPNKWVIWCGMNGICWLLAITEALAMLICVDFLS